jgi:hybrid polyketide synthase/nonribosomal peptide synthetase FtdB
MDDDTSSKQLRRYLAERLPAYMIPTHIVALSALPITTNGKVDRASLQQRAPHCRAVGPSPERAALKSG